MTDEERARAQALLAQELPRLVVEGATGAIFIVFGLMLGALTGTIVIVFASSILGLPFGGWMRHGQATFALLGGALATWAVWAPYGARREKVRPLEEDVAAGIVEVLEVEAFIAWAEPDAVPAFTLDVAEAAPLVVRGEALAAAAADGRFPCRRFRLVRLPVTKHAVALEPQGDPLPIRA
jgi:hypothetical protein